MSLPAIGTRPVAAILVALACGGLAAIVVPRFDLSGTAQLLVVIAAALVGAAAVTLLGRRTTETRDVPPPRT